MTIEMSGQASIHIEASPTQVYELVSDITRMGEWSPECVGASWANGDTQPTVGAQFHGNNRRGENEWTTPNTIVVADEGKEFAWVVGTPDFEVCRWRFVLTPEGDGTNVTESFELGTERVGFTAAVLERPESERAPLIDARRSQLVEDMQQTLGRLKEYAERTDPTEARSAPS